MLIATIFISLLRRGLKSIESVSMVLPPSLEKKLLRRLQAQTLPVATSSLGKILPFTKITVTFEPTKQFRCPLRFRIFNKKIETLYILQLKAPS